MDADKFCRSGRDEGRVNGAIYIPRTLIPRQHDPKEIVTDGLNGAPKWERAIRVTFSQVHCIPWGSRQFALFSIKISIKGANLVILLAFYPINFYPIQEGLKLKLS